MRILAVVHDELIGGDEGRDWAVLESLVSANRPESVIEVRVLATVNRPRTALVFGNPLTKAVGRTAGGSGGGHNPGQSARDRLDRATRSLRGTGVRVSGDIVEGRIVRAVRREVRAGGYDRVLLLWRDEREPLRRRGTLARLRLLVRIPVDAPRAGEILPPDL